MRASAFSNLFAVYMTMLFFASTASANYFIIDEPHLSAQWSNGATNLITWSKALRDNIHGFDVEMARLNSNGLTLVARNVPASQGKLNIFLQDFPAGDDYFLIFINSTHGVMHTTSSRFTILDASSTPTDTSRPSPATGIPTVTLSGSPNPTLPFATTFPAIASGARLDVLNIPISQLIIVSLGVILGAAWTLVPLS
ncbi:hypothetical protein JR316_0011101 [Psilocybe cubensis]|uniref:Uncharacterized protein n=2 Tax=Psilocybe cubensis TaxID=181762 RepID=A0ACB8GN88_PSICU|nr:hypothetical protein JR316_0011101 [Psilocybe cubensis]KAH9477183.1 hypothetical protein JR316_0011101 [Psilocybe cubensis]